MSTNGETKKKQQLNLDEMWLFVSADSGDRFLRRFVARRYGSDAAEPSLPGTERPRRRLQPPGPENNVSHVT